MSTREYAMLIKNELDIIRTKYDIDLPNSVIILEVLKQFNGVKRTFFEDLDNRELQRYIFNREKEKVDKQIYEITGRNFDDTKPKVSKPIQETPEWEHTMHEYFGN